MKMETIYQNLWNTAKAVLVQKFIAISTNITRKKISNKQPNFTHQGTVKRRTK